MFVSKKDLDLINFKLNKLEEDLRAEINALKLDYKKDTPTKPKSKKTQ